MVIFIEKERDFMRTKLLPKVFLWLFIGLLITFISGYFVSTNTKMLGNIYNSGLYWVFVILEVVVAFILSLKVATLNKHVAICLYIFYTFLTGLTISFVFEAYKIDSIIIIFLITSVLFAIFALIGKFTKIDLSKFWVYLLIGVIAIVVLSIVNTFILSEKLNIFTCILGIVVFLGYVAFDINRIVKTPDYDEISDSAYPIVFAFNLYIDFINVFLDLLRLFGDFDNN